MKISNILEKITQDVIIKSGKKNAEISDIAINSRLVQKNSIFFALKGLAMDGNKFIQDAIDKGASIIVSNQDFDSDVLQKNDCTFINVKNCFNLLIEFLQIFYNKLPCNIYAVTGTNGKTSTAEFIRQILQLINKESASIGTLGVVCSQEIKKNIPDSSLTTPDIVTIYKILHILKANNIDDVAIEVSSIGFEQNRVAGLNINCGIFTNFTQDHLDYHSDMNEYFRCKMLLFNNILQKNSPAVINSDIPEALQIKEICQKNGLQIFDYGKKAQKLQIINIENENFGQKISFRFLDKEFFFNIQSSAKFEAYNIFCALTTIIAKYNLQKEQIEELLPKLQRLKSAQGRMQRVAILPNKAQIFIDFAHTPDSLIKILQQARNMTKSRLLILFGCGGDRDTKKRPQMGKIACELADLAIITDDNPRYEDPAQIRYDIVKSCKKDKFIEIEDRKIAIKKAISLLQENDILILAGKGHEKYQIIGDKKIELDEEKIITKHLNDKKYHA